MTKFMDIWAGWGHFKLRHPIPVCVELSGNRMIIKSYELGLEGNSTAVSRAAFLFSQAFEEKWTQLGCMVRPDPGTHPTGLSGDELVKWKMEWHVEQMTRTDGWWLHKIGNLARQAQWGIQPMESDGDMASDFVKDTLKALLKSERVPKNEAVFSPLLSYEDGLEMSWVNDRINARARIHEGVMFYHVVTPDEVLLDLRSTMRRMGPPAEFLEALASMFSDGATGG